MALTVLAGSANAFVIDGTLDATYPSSAVTQLNATGFGQSTLGQFSAADGSELNGAHAEVTASDLFLHLGGNLQSNFNKLTLFFDPNNGTVGQNVLSGLGGWAGNYNGMTFDSGFSPAFAISITHGNVSGGGANSEMYVDYASFNGSSWTTTYWGQILNGTGNTWNGTGGDRPTGFLAQINNTNTASNVNTGVEIKLPLSLIGSPTWGSNMKIAAMINGSGHDYLSNQVLGSLPAGTGNLGGNGTGTFTGNVGAINFNSFAGDQFFAVPEPTSMAAIAVGIAALARRKKKNS